MSATITFLTPALYEYLISVSVRKNNSITKLNDITNSEVGIPMQSSVEQLNFLAFLVQLTQAKNILEIGTFTGLSALAMAQQLPRDGKIICLDKSEEFTQVAKNYWKKAGVSSKIRLWLGDALDSLSQMKVTHHDAFDLVFIDADKANYRAYYEDALTMVRKGGLILLDNVLWKGAVIDPADQRKKTDAIRTFNEFLYQDDRVSISMLPIGDGLTLALKK